MSQLPHGCNTTHPDYVPRRPYYFAPNGLEIDRYAGTAIIKMERVMNVLSKDCQYSKHRDDVRCANCERQAK